MNTLFASYYLLNEKWREILNEFFEQIHSRLILSVYYMWLVSFFIIYYCTLLLSFFSFCWCNGPANKVIKETVKNCLCSHPCCYYQQLHQHVPKHVKKNTGTLKTSLNRVGNRWIIDTDNPQEYWQLMNEYTRVELGQPTRGTLEATIQESSLTLSYIRYLGYRPFFYLI